MIVGTKDIPVQDIIDNLTRLPYYCEELIPPPLRGNINILNNQKYYVSLLLGKLYKVEYATRMDYVESLMQGVYVTGTLSSISDFRDLITECDREYLLHLLKEDGYA